MTGIEVLKAPTTTAEEISDIISKPCPPITPAECDRVSCRECWLAWLTTGEPPKAKGPSDKQTAPGEDGMHPILTEFYERYFRAQKKVEQETRAVLNHLATGGRE